jgi:hypothetical protein
MMGVFNCCYISHLKKKDVSVVIKELTNPHFDGTQNIQPYNKVNTILLQVGIISQIW